MMPERKLNRASLEVKKELAKIHSSLLLTISSAGNRERIRLPELDRLVFAATASYHIDQTTRFEEVSSELEWTAPDLPDAILRSLRSHFKLHRIHVTDTTV